MDRARCCGGKCERSPLIRAAVLGYLSEKSPTNKIVAEMIKTLEAKTLPGTDDITHLYMKSVYQKTRFDMAMQAGDIAAALKHLQAMNDIPDKFCFSASPPQNAPSVSMETLEKWLRDKQK
jgi:hypothetical protein